MLIYSHCFEKFKNALETLTYDISAPCTGETIEIQTALVWGLNENTYESVLTAVSVDWLNEWLEDKK